MSLYRIGFSAMAVAASCVVAIFVYALHAPTRPLIRPWTTTVIEQGSNDGWSERMTFTGGQREITVLNLKR